MRPIIVVPGNSPASIKRKQAIIDAWEQIPEKAKQVAGYLIRSITSLPPRRKEGPDGIRAVLYGGSLTIPYFSDPSEIWHEVGHALVSEGLSPEELREADRFYDFSKEKRPPGEVISEDFYFMMKGDRLSPFWQWWFENDAKGDEWMKTGMEKITSLERTASINPLQVVEASLDALADLIYDSDNEELVWYYGIAREALKDAQKEDRLSYESRSAPHQYYYPEDVVNLKDRLRKLPMAEPLRVERPDVTMRGTPGTSRGLV